LHPLLLTALEGCNFAWLHLVSAPFLCDNLLNSATSFEKVTKDNYNCCFFMDRLQERLGVMFCGAYWCLAEQHTVKLFECPKFHYSFQIEKICIVIANKENKEK
jgi:hypothetical protein